MKRLMILFAVSIITLSVMTSCSENYSNGERIGFVTKFSQKGLIFDSWEGELNLTQTGMNTSSTFQFSIDNDNVPENLIATLDSAAIQGWKVKIKYHETFGKNWFNNRGETDYFATHIVVLDRTPMDIFSGGKRDTTYQNIKGKVIDTIYVVIYKDCPNHK